MLITAMNPLLTLHFFKGITNAEKQAIIASDQFNEKDLKPTVYQQYKRKEDFDSRWEKAALLASMEYEICQREGVVILYVNDVDNFPSVLREIPDPPVVLFGRGRWNNKKVPLSIIGSRKMTNYGKFQCRRFVEDLSQFPINIISGLAMGIDEVAHQTALDCGATTQAFLAGGLGHISPKKNAILAQQIMNSGGGYFTEQPFHVASLPPYYPVRNRLIAGAALATLVIEAARKSGAMITANQAFNYGREVFALPGALFQPMSEGPNKLIADEIASIALDPGTFASNFYPLWSKNRSKIDLSKSFEGQLIQHFPHGRKVHSSYLKKYFEVNNSQLFKSLHVLIELGVLQRIGVHTYARKTAD